MMHYHQPLRSVTPPTLPVGGVSGRSAGSYSSAQSFQAPPRTSVPMGGSARPSFAAQPRPSEDFHNTMAQWQSRLTTESSRMRNLESEEEQLHSEEVALRTRLQEIQCENRQLDQDYITAQHAWSRLYELENRYYNEPVPDHTQDILSWEYEAAIATKRVEETSAELDALQKEVQGLSHVTDKRREQGTRLQRLETRFGSVDERRRKCLEVAERVFDVESERAQVLGEELAMLETDVATFHVDAVAEVPQQPATRRVRTSEIPQTNISILSTTGRFSGGESATSESACPLRTLPTNVAPARATTSLGMIGRQARELMEDKSWNNSRRSSYSRPTTTHQVEAQEEQRYTTTTKAASIQPVHSQSMMSEDIGGSSMCLGLDDDLGAQSMVFSLAPPTSRTR